jgi:adenine phosphoribosyltransferase
VWVCSFGSAYDPFMRTTEAHDKLNALIEDVPDFPKPGVVFKDFTPLLADPASLALAVELMANPYRGKGIDLVVGAESRGFIFGIAIAQALSAGFVPVRKPGKLPRTVHGVDYDLEYGTDRLELHADALMRGQKVLLVDDLLATGGTMKASCELVQRTGAEIAGITVLIELNFLHGRSQLEGFGEVHSVLKYD